MDACLPQTKSKTKPAMGCGFSLAMIIEWQCWHKNKWNKHIVASLGQKFKSSVDHESSEVLEQLPRKKGSRKSMLIWKGLLYFFYKRHFMMWFSEQAKNWSLPVLCTVMGDVPSLPILTFMWPSSRCKFALCSDKASVYVHKWHILQTAKAGTGLSTV